MAAKLFLLFGLSLLFSGGVLLGFKKYFHLTCKMVALVFSLGAFSTLPFFLAKYLLTYTVLGTFFQIIQGTVLAYLFLAFLEEINKHQADKQSRKLGKNQKIQLAVLVGLGFAFVENLYYGYTALGEQTFLFFFPLRLILGSSAHALFSGVVGAYEAQADQEKKRYLLPMGLSIAAGCHGLFNYVLYLGLPHLALIVLVVGYRWILRRKMRKVLKNRC